MRRSTRLFGTHNAADGVARCLRAHKVARIGAEGIRRRRTRDFLFAIVVLRVRARTDDGVARRGVDVLEERRRAVRHRVVILGFCGIELEAVVLAREERPEDADQAEQKDDAGGDGDGDENNNASRQEVCEHTVSFEVSLEGKLYLRRCVKLKVEKE